MKKVILIVCTVILGVYIGSTYIIGTNPSSLQSGATSMMSTASAEIKTISTAE